jgi:hypothetical protein
MLANEGIGENLNGTKLFLIGIYSFISSSEELKKWYSVK